ncbi:ETX/MTX2 family pore-forming toxin [Candidatus Enterococcus ikei]|uniref:ETX/MTX2 family pore-forming toxin n=1 Tax=Candidatus Enterococcus ikei TaxID=2815326 RepID=A0ABS3H1U7_9ENTE|nr:ETX/MTX2 family pore-forming toxin [Enterococcus sp. DIV0869a]MBO0441149.1 ETX/MTX2 family pore-forming toxin [Enterococcus sp. DIV0869a]
MKLKRILFAATFFVFSSMCTSSLSIAHAEQLSDDTVHSSPEFNQTLKEHLGKFGWQLGLFYGKNGTLPSGAIPLFDYKLPGIDVSTPKVSANILNRSELESLHAGEATFTNNSDEKQDYQSQEFQKTFETSVTTTTTHTAGFGFEASGKIGIPIVAEGGIKLSAKYDFSTSRSQIEKSADVYTMKSQKVSVPPKRKYLIQAKLFVGKATGQLNLASTVTGEVFYAKELQGDKLYAQSVGKTISDYQKNINDLPSQYFLKYWQYKPELGDAANARLGLADFTAQYGSHMEVETYDVTDGDPVFIKSEKAEFAKVSNS